MAVDMAGPGMTDVDLYPEPGFYGAEGDPWTYIVMPNGTISVTNGKEGEDDRMRVVREGSEAHAEILKQIQSGQLKTQPKSYTASRPGPEASAAPAGEAKAPRSYTDRLDEVTGDKMSSKLLAKAVPPGKFTVSDPVEPTEDKSGSVRDVVGAALTGAGEHGPAAVPVTVGKAIGQGAVAGVAAARDAGKAAGESVSRALSSLMSVATDDEKGVLAQMKSRLYGRES